MNLYITLVIMLLSASQLFGAVLYVDRTLGSNITNGTYSIANRNATGNSGNAYTTIQAAVNACSAGDTIYMRGGTYSEYNIVIPNTVRGPEWTTLSSYPGEWAILNGGGIQDAAITHTLGFGEYQKRNLANQTSYWRFERFEVTGYASAFWFSGGPQWYRYLYLHDNTSNVQLAAAIWITLPHDCIIEYCYFYNNDQSSSINAQYGHIAFNNDYLDDESPTTFNPDVCTKKNTIRYNFMNDSTFGIHYKNQQRFGTNTRTAASVALNYGTWGDKIHHNIIINNVRNGILFDQDNAQAYNNIIEVSSYGAIQFGQEVQLSSDNTMLYNCVAYNNTVINSGKSYGSNAGGDPASSHPYIYFYNNISDRNGSSDAQGRPFTIAADMNTGYYADLSDTHIEHNLIHSNAATTDILRGRADYYSLSDAQSRFITINGNWSNSTSGLFRGTTGADKYKTNVSFVLSGSTTISNGGIGGSHPYLAGVTIPSYVGAVDPNSSSWVDTVLGLSNVSNLIDGGSGGGSTPPAQDTNPPASPSGVIIRIQ